MITSNEFLVIPEYSGKYPEGNAKLREVESYLPFINEHLQQMKKDKSFIVPNIKEGASTIIDSLIKRTPSLEGKIDNRYYKFTGKKVIVNSSFFIREYRKTNEGRSYSLELSKNCPLLLGKLIKVKL